MAPPAPAPPARIDALTSLRFFAALAVLASHLWMLEEQPNRLQPLAAAVFHEGYSGVGFFFVLSGYILAHTYQRPLAEGRVSHRTYLRLRLARIVPLHLLTALPFAAVLLWTGGWRAAPRALANLALLQSWVPDPAVYFSLNEPSWSLSDELFFYTAFLGLIRLSPRALGWIGVALLAAVGAMLALRIGTGHGAISAGGAPTLTHWLAYINPLTRSLDFIAGMLLYRWPRRRLASHWQTLSEGAAPALLLATMAAATHWQWPAALRLQLLYLPLMALIVRVYASGGGVLSRALAARWLVLLGDASFALYLVHLPLLHGGWAWYTRSDLPPLPLPVFAAAITALCVAVSLLVYRWIEVPLLRRLRSAILARPSAV